MGVGQRKLCTHSIFTEFQLGFQCDADMTPLKFMNAWHGMIFNDGMIPAVPGSNLESLSINCFPKIELIVYRTQNIIVEIFL